MHQIKAVKQVQAFATKSAVLEHHKDIEGVLLKGVEQDYDFSNLQQFLKQGRWISFSDSLYSKEIVLSEPVANQLQIKLNDTVTVYFISAGEHKSSARKLLVCGIYKTGIEEYDKLFAIGDLRLLRRINNWNNDQIGGYEVFLTDYTLMDTVNNSLYDTYQLPGAWVSKTIKEIDPYIFDWLDIQDVNRDVIFWVMAIVAVINLITCLLILVLERTKMVGVLKAMGSSDWEIQKIFLYYATWIAARGILIGFVTGIAICLLQQYSGFIQLNESAYYVTKAPVFIIWWQVGMVCAVTFIICYLCLLLPTFLIRTISPVKAIQFR